MGAFVVCFVILIFNIDMNNRGSFLGRAPYLLSFYQMLTLRATFGSCDLRNIWQVFAFGKGDEIALDYLKELRQNGTDRRTELSTLISGGLVEYREIKAAEEAEVWEDREWHKH